MANPKAKSLLEIREQMGGTVVFGIKKKRKEIEFGGWFWS